MKTPEEIKKGLFVCSDLEGNCPYCPYAVNSKPEPEGMCVKELANDALPYIQQLEAQVPKWISVHDALPGMDEKVLFHPMCNEKSIYIGKLTYVGESNAVYFAVRNGKRKVVYSATHWMPLPELPKEEETCS